MIHFRPPTIPLKVTDKEMALAVPVDLTEKLQSERQERSLKKHRFSDALREYWRRRRHPTSVGDNMASAAETESGTT